MSKLSRKRLLEEFREDPYRAGAESWALEIPWSEICNGTYRNYGQLCAESGIDIYDAFKEALRCLSDLYDDMGWR